MQFDISGNVLCAVMVICAATVLGISAWRNK